MNQSATWQQSGDHHALLNLAGAHCRLRSNSHAVVQTLEPFITPSLRTPAMLLDVHITSAADAREPVHFRGMGHVVIAEYGANVLLVDLARNIVHAWITEAAARDRALWSEQWVPLIVGIAGLAAGVLPLHSACVVKNGRGLLIAGESMAGKSTFSVAMAQQGFHLLSDDWTYIHRDESSLVACGFDVPVKLLPDAVAFFPELHTLEPARTLNGEVAYTAPASHLGITAAQDCEIAAMLFLHRTPSASPSFIRADAGFARSYVQNSVERLPSGLRELQLAREQLIDRIGQLPSWHYNYCASPREGAAFAAAFLNATGVFA